MTGTLLTNARECHATIPLPAKSIMDGSSCLHTEAHTHTHTHTHTRKRCSTHFTHSLQSAPPLHACTLVLCAVRLAGWLQAGETALHVACLLVTLSGYRSDSAGEFEQLVASLSPHTHDADYEAAFRKGRERIEDGWGVGVGWWGWVGGGDWEGGMWLKEKWVFVGGGGPSEHGA